MHMLLLEPIIHSGHGLDMMIRIMLFPRTGLSFIATL